MKITVPAEVGVPVRLIEPVPLPEIVSPVVLVTFETPKVTGAVPPVNAIVLL